MFSRIGRAFGWSPEAEEAKQEDDAIGELDRMVHAAAPLYALERNLGWIEFNKRLVSMKENVLKLMLAGKQEHFELFRAQIKTIDEIMAIVPKALEDGQMAQEQLNQIQDREVEALQPES